MNTCIVLRDLISGNTGLIFTHFVNIAVAFSAKLWNIFFIGNSCKTFLFRHGNISVVTVWIAPMAPGTGKSCLHMYIIGIKIFGHIVIILMTGYTLIIFR